MTKYQSIIDPVNNNETIVRSNEDGTVSYIPTNPFNSDYQTYLQYLAENTNEMLEQQTMKGSN